jgi:hypothetical protein
MWTRMRSDGEFDREVVDTINININDDRDRGRLVALVAVAVGTIAVVVVAALSRAARLVSIPLPRRLIGVVTVSFLEVRGRRLFFLMADEGGRRKEEVAVGRSKFPIVSLYSRII